MLIVLPPSETKVSGGHDGQTLDLEALSFPSQNTIRASLVDQLVTLAADPELSVKALKLGPKGLPEVVRNAQLRESGVLPAISRYTGVLYDALGRDTLDAAASTALNHSVAIFSALFGLIRAQDLIPAYRLSWDSALPMGKPGLQWAQGPQSVWDNVSDFVLDLRSEGYRSLAPVPEDIGVYINLVQPGPRGKRKALGHANKATKGALLRALVSEGASLESVTELIQWGQSVGYWFDQDSQSEGRIDLVMSGS